jgi:hypothetical protein
VFVLIILIFCIFLFLDLHSYPSHYPPSSFSLLLHHYYYHYHCDPFTEAHLLCALHWQTWPASHLGKSTMLSSVITFQYFYLSVDLLLFNFSISPDLPTCPVMNSDVSISCSTSCSVSLDIRLACEVELHSYRIFHAIPFLSFSL